MISETSSCNLILLAGYTEGNFEMGMNEEKRGKIPWWDTFLEIMKPPNTTV